MAEIGEKGPDVHAFTAGVRLLPGDAIDFAGSEVGNACRLIDRGVQRHRDDARRGAHEDASKH